jgi:putative transposase
MACRVNTTELSAAVELIATQGVEGLNKAFEVLYNEAMKVERSRFLQAEPYQRTQERVDYANGYKPKQLNSRLGKLDLLIPQVRSGQFYPNLLDKGSRSERALKVAIAEMYIQGVSTRNVSEAMEVLCGFEVSSTDVSRATALLEDQLAAWRNRPLGYYRYLFLDARYEKARIDNIVRDCAVFIAIGINAQGLREILGISVSLSEHEIHWRSFLQGLQQRGLHGIELIISDAHAGLKEARKALFAAVPWQRCQFHLQQNAQGHVPKKSMKAQVAFDIRAIFNAPNLEEAQRLLKLMVNKYQQTASQLAQWMETNIPQGFSVFNFPSNHWRKLRTTNPLERVNREIKRRTQVVSIFPNTQACERLITALLIEMSEEWMSATTYIVIANENSAFL